MGIFCKPYIRVLHYIILLFVIKFSNAFYLPGMAPVLYCKSNAIGNSGSAKCEVSFIYNYGNILECWII